MRWNTLLQLHKCCCHSSCLSPSSSATLPWPMPPQSSSKGYNIPLTFTKHFHQKVWSSRYFHRCHFFSHMLILTFHLLSEIHLKTKHPVKCVNVLIIFLNTPVYEFIFLIWHTFNLCVGFFFLTLLILILGKLGIRIGGKKKNQRSCSFLPLVLFTLLPLLENFFCFPLCNFSSPN